MAKVIIIPADMGQPIRQINAESYEDYRDAVGGYIEYVPTMLDNTAMYINEEGKEHGLVHNPRATKLVRLFPGDFISGDAVLFGFDDSGEELDCPYSTEEIEGLSRP